MFVHKFFYVGNGGDHGPPYFLLPWSQNVSYNSNGLGLGLGIG